jgi:type II secretory pathway pseudopilin PulG
MRKPIKRSASGFTYIGVLFAVALAGVALALTAQVWRTTSQRAKEEQLLFAGGQFMQAIERYRQQSPGTVRQYPKSLDDLLQDRRYPDVRRYLRKLYADPMTGKPDWGLVRASDGGITGVYSLSTDKPIRIVATIINGLPIGGGEKYSDWRFVSDPGSAASSAGVQAAAQTAGGTPSAPAGPAATTQSRPQIDDSAGCRMVVVNNMLFCQDN